MTYRKPYFIGGALCDDDKTCREAIEEAEAQAMMQEELQRLIDEAEGAVVPTIDLTDPQADE